MIRLSRVIEIGRSHRLLALLFGLDGAPVTVLVRLLGGLAFYTAVVFIWKARFLIKCIAEIHTVLGSIILFSCN